MARWPGPILVAALGLTLLAALPLAGMRVGFNEPAATPSSTDSNRGYASADRHFSANALLPDVIAIQADHDLRNPAGLIAIERVTRHIMAVPGVRAVQSASRPDGKVPEQATLSYQAGVLGRQFGDTMDSLTRRLQRVSELDGALAQTQAAVDGLGNGLRGGSAGLADMSGAAEDMRAGMDGLQRNVTTVSGYLDPLRDIVGRTPTAPPIRSARRWTGCCSPSTAWCRPPRGSMPARRN